MAQTKPQSRKFIAGSATVLVGKRLDKLVNIGACRGINVEETKTTAAVESDNAGDVATLVTDHSMQVTLESLELDWTKYKMMRGDVDNLEVYDGKTKVTKEYIVSKGTWEDGEEISIPVKNADGTNAKVLKVFAEADSIRSELTADDDYTLSNDENSLSILSADINPENTTLYISYEWTPKAMERFTTGGGDNFISPLIMKLVNTNSKGEEFRVIVPHASVDGGLKLPYSSDKANDVMKVPFTFKASMNTDYARGEQLAIIENEQNQIKA